MNINSKNLFSITLSIIFSILSLEFLARLLPATDSFALEMPIECKNLEKLNLNCFHRRKKYSYGRVTKGKFPPFEMDALKSANDIGQYTNIDLTDFIKFKDSSRIIRLLSIGDSQVESLQVDNSESFHGLFNNKSININDFQGDFEFVSTAIGSSGMALPNYIMYLKYVSDITSLESDFVIIQIQPNDFDESFEEYALQGRRNGRGQFFFDSSGEIYFRDFPPDNNSEKLVSFLLNNSYLARYLTYNVPLLKNIKYSKIFCFINNKSGQCIDSISQNYRTNIIDESYESNPERYEIGFKASKMFLKKLETFRNKTLSKKNTILIIDADRGYISGKYDEKGNYFDEQRNYLIKEAENMGFTVIDLEEAFKKKFYEGFSLNSKVDGHWNESGHQIVFQELLNEIKQLIKNKEFNTTLKK